MEGHHANAGAKRRSNRSDVASAAGFAALLVGLVLSAGGIEIAQADPAPKPDQLIWLDGEAVGTASPAASCEAGSTQPRAAATAEAAPQQTVRVLAHELGGAVANQPRVIPLNSRGYNYAPGLKAAKVRGD